MNKTKMIYLIAAISMLLSCGIGQKKANEIKKPNIIYILADDLGYGDLGCYGQTKIETPHIDALAKAGMKFTQHYSAAPVCAPTRCCLLTGKHMGHSQVRGNDEWPERGDIWDYAKAVEDPGLEGQRPISPNTVTIGNLLQSAGYKTGMVGKWGLGAPLTESVPNNMGFDFFYGYNCQRQAHTYYPRHLWKNNEKVELENKLVAPGTKLKEGAGPYDEASYSDFDQEQYAPDLMHREALGFINENKDNPFFLYYASPIPHLALQAPKRWVDYYVDKFGDEEPYDGADGYFPCRYPRATYAAMVSYLDEQVGELVAALKELGIYENTLIIFTSDNGPTYTGGSDSPWFNSGGPFKSEYGWGKGFLREGGIRVPMIASWEGVIGPESKSGHISGFWDIMPTFCDIAQIEKPLDIDGISFLPELKGETQPQHEHLYWEFPNYGGQQAVVLGEWKGIRTDMRAGNMSIELYNLTTDLKEQNNVAGQHPELVKRIEEIMKEEHQRSDNENWHFDVLGD